jgi:hypothetical protein
VGHPPAGGTGQVSRGPQPQGPPGLGLLVRMGSRLRPVALGLAAWVRTPRRRRAIRWRAQSPDGARRAGAGPSGRWRAAILRQAAARARPQLARVSGVS